MFTKGYLYFIQVSDFSMPDEAREYKRFHPSGVLIVWEWELYKFDEDVDNSETTTTEEESSEDEVEIESAAVSLCHKLS